MKKKKGTRNTYRKRHTRTGAGGGGAVINKIGLAGSERAIALWRDARKGVGV
jgi:hypothetical protein